MLASLALQALAFAPPPVSRRAALVSAGVMLGTSQSTLALPGLPDGTREVMTTVVLPSGVEVSRRRFTGAGDPGWSYPQRDVSTAVFKPYAASWPYAPADFLRQDEAPDTTFYRAPKLVYHIDEGAVAALSRYYDANIAAGSDVLNHLLVVSASLQRRR